jgi:hypothetical protein
MLAIAESINWPSVVPSMGVNIHRSTRASVLAPRMDSGASADQGRIWTIYFSR